MNNQTIKDIQSKILEIMMFIDKICRSNEIVYYIMGGTALGAVRHKGFIPWDDDLDIFMTPDNYQKFNAAFNQINNDMFILQEWKEVEDYLEYAKVRMNGTTFIEEVYKDRKDMHHGIYVDIMILHKCPNSLIIQKTIYYASKYVTLLSLSKRNWKPKTKVQKCMLHILKVIPNKWLCKRCYKWIYKYDNWQDDYKYCYYITPAKFKNGLFDKEMFQQPVDTKFENVVLMGPTKITKYLELRYKNYMKLPSKEQQKKAVHAMIFDTEIGFEQYIYQ